MTTAQKLISHLVPCLGSDRTRWGNYPDEVALRIGALHRQIGGGDWYTFPDGSTIRVGPGGLFTRVVGRADEESALQIIGNFP